jgi:hypothetical protein
VTDAPLAWGAKVSPAFRAKVRSIAAELPTDPSDLMACMAWESGRSFRTDVRNMAGSGAVGLIQIMPAVAAELGTTAEALAVLTPEQQLDWVERYFAMWKRRLKLTKPLSLSDLYMCILFPTAAGKPDSFVLFDVHDLDHPARYRQNAGLDTNKDGLVAKAEAAARVHAMRAEGLRPLNVA